MNIFRSSDLELYGDLVTLCGEDIEFIVNSLYDFNGWIVQPVVVPAKVNKSIDNMYLTGLDHYCGQ